MRPGAFRRFAKSAILKWATAPFGRTWKTCSEGSWGGFRTTYYQYLSANRTTVVLSNRGNFDPDKFWYALNDVVEESEGENGP